MAKWGEGDPRWIVEERPDATNVNNWHWSEKDASVWSRSKLKHLLLGLVFDGPNGSCEVTEVTKVDGEATVNNRKGKLIFFYEWTIKLKWTGQPVDSGDKVSGELEIPNLSEEIDMDEVDVIVTVKKRSPEAHQLKDHMNKVAPPIIREKFAEYLRCMKEEYSQGLILPLRKSDQTGLQPVPVVQTGKTPAPAQPAAKPSEGPPREVGCRIPTTKITVRETFTTSVEELYNALTSQELVQMFTGSKAVLETRSGGDYSILDGLITGRFVELERPCRIVQLWREKSWPDGHHSTVTIKLTQDVDYTTLILVQTEVPDADSDRTREWWKRHIFERIKSAFGYDMMLL